MNVSQWSRIRRLRKPGFTTSAARLDCACKSRRCTGRGNALHAPADCTSPVCQCSDTHCARRRRCTLRNRLRRVRADNERTNLSSGEPILIAQEPRRLLPSDAGQLLRSPGDQRRRLFPFSSAVAARSHRRDRAAATSAPTPRAMLSRSRPRARRCGRHLAAHGPGPR